MAYGFPSGFHTTTDMHVCLPPFLVVTSVKGGSQALVGIGGFRVSSLGRLTPLLAPLPPPSTPPFPSTPSFPYPSLSPSLPALPLSPLEVGH